MAVWDRNAQRVADAVRLVQRFVSGFRVVAKTKSRFHRALGWLFSKVGGSAYMREFWTTTGYTAAYPSQFDNSFDAAAFCDVMHEGTHATDASRLTRVGFALIYFFPQVFAIPVALGAIWGPWWLVLVGLGLLLPLPAPGRLWLELRAYGNDCAVQWWWLQDNEQQIKRGNDVADYLSNGSYYWALPFRAWILKKVFARQEAINAGAALAPYLAACKALAERYRTEDSPG